LLGIASSFLSIIEFDEVAGSPGNYVTGWHCLRTRMRRELALALVFFFFGRCLGEKGVSWGLASLQTAARARAEEGA
jgi:hypothetical protein